MKLSQYINRYKKHHRSNRGALFLKLLKAAGTGSNRIWGDLNMLFFGDPELKSRPKAFGATAVPLQHILNQSHSNSKLFHNFRQLTQIHHYTISAKNYYGAAFIQEAQEKHTAQPTSGTSLPPDRKSNLSPQDGFTKLLFHFFKPSFFSKSISFSDQAIKNVVTASEFQAIKKATDDNSNLGTPVSTFEPPASGIQSLTKITGTYSGIIKYKTILKELKKNTSRLPGYGFPAPESEMQPPVFNSPASANPIQAGFGSIKYKTILKKLKKNTSRLPGYGFPAPESETQFPVFNSPASANPIQAGFGSITYKTILKKLKKNNSWFPVYGMQPSGFNSPASANHTQAGFGSITYKTILKNIKKMNSGFQSPVFNLQHPTTAISNIQNREIKHTIDNMNNATQKTVHINFSIGKFQDNINIHTTQLHESTTEIEQKVTQIFTKILDDASKISKRY